MRRNKHLPSSTTACSSEAKYNESILRGASRVPGSDTMLYFPGPNSSVPYEYFINPSCVSFFRIPIVWIGEQKITSDYTRLFRELSKLPLCVGSTVTYMQKSQGYFFNLLLKQDLRLTVCQYEDEWEKGVYVNVVLNGEPVIQDFMRVDQLIASINDFYNGAEE